MPDIFDDIHEQQQPNVFHRAAQPSGIAGLIADSRFDSADLARIWAASSDEEKASIRSPLMARLGKVKPKNALEAASWRQLRSTVQASSGG